MRYIIYPVLNYQLYNKFTFIVGLTKNYSEQQLVDCAYKGGCHPGNYEVAWRYLASAGGQCTEDAYPYHAEDETCVDSEITKAASVSTTYPITRLYTVNSMMTVLANNGLVAVAIYATEIFYYFG